MKKSEAKKPTKPNDSKEKKDEGSIFRRVQELDKLNARRAQLEEELDDLLREKDFSVDKPHGFHPDFLGELEHFAEAFADASSNNRASELGQAALKASEELRAVTKKLADFVDAAVNGQHPEHVIIVPEFPRHLYSIEREERDAIANVGDIHDAVHAVLLNFFKYQNTERARQAAFEDMCAIIDDGYGDPVTNNDADLTDELYDRETAFIMNLKLDAAEKLQIAERFLQPILAAVNRRFERARLISYGRLPDSSLMLRVRVEQYSPELWQTRNFLTRRKAW